MAGHEVRVVHRPAQGVREDEAEISPRAVRLRPSTLRVLNLVVPEERTHGGVGEAHAVLGIKRVPNARLLAEAETLEHLASSEGAETVGELRETLLTALQEEGVDPEDVWALGVELPYAVDVSWSDPGRDGSYDVVFRRHETAASRGVPLFSGGRTASLRPWDFYANNPLRAKLARSLLPELRGYLQKKLPEYMVPSAFTLLDELPLTPNGKVNRKALPAPDLSGFRAENAYAEPRTPAEEALAGTWEEVLGLERVGIHDDFFELGGHSLLAMQVVARLYRHFGVELPLHILFEHPNIAELALAVTQMQAEAESDIEQMLAQVEQLQGHSIPQEMERILAEQLEDTSDEERL